MTVFVHSRGKITLSPIWIWIYAAFSHSVPLPNMLSPQHQQQTEFLWNQEFCLSANMAEEKIYFLFVIFFKCKCISQNPTLCVSGLLILSVIGPDYETRSTLLTIDDQGKFQDFTEISEHTFPSNTCVQMPICHFHKGLKATTKLTILSGAFIRTASYGVEITSWKTCSWPVLVSVYKIIWPNLCTFHKSSSIWWCVCIHCTAP